MKPTAPCIYPNYPLRDGRRDGGGETQCPARERDGSRCTAASEMFTYGHLCARHATMLRAGVKVVLVNGTRLDTPWTMPRRLGLWVQRG